MIQRFDFAIHRQTWNGPYTKLQNENAQTFEHSLQHNNLLGHNDALNPT